MPYNTYNPNYIPEQLTLDSMNMNFKVDGKGIEKITVNSDRVKHATIGDFNSNNRLINGGHGQENIDYLIEHNIPFNITKEYPNGVRVGNIPSHKNKTKRSGEDQAWFPKDWKLEDIQEAGEYVANLPQNVVKGDGVWMFGEYKGVRVSVIKINGQIGTITPDNSKQPGGNVK